MWSIVLALISLFPQGAKQNAIQIGEDRLLSAEGPSHPLAESHLSISPVNSKHLLAGVIQFDSPDGNGRTCVAWTSFDSGQHWSRHAFPAKGCGDPWGAILSDGSAIMVMLGAIPGRDDNLFLFRSSDGGRTWPDVPQGLGGHHDHPIIVARGSEVFVVAAEGVHNAAGQHRNAVSVLRSQDGGKSFGQPSRVIASNLVYEAEGPALLTDDTLVVGFHDHNRQGSDKRLVRPRIWVVRSADHAQSFSEPLLVSESCEGYGGWPSMAADSSNRLFWICVGDKFNGVLVQRSDDKGESWSEPLRLNHTERANSFTPSIAINKEGIIGASWYEVHDRNCFDVYFTASLDAGRSFLPEVRISSATSCPDTPQNKGVFEPERTFGAGGDYSGLAAAPDGTFHIVWSDARSGIYQLRTAAITVTH